MRRFTSSLFLFLAVLVPSVGNAQAYRFHTQAPRVTAAAVAWQVNGEPAIFQGEYYLATAQRIFFDPNVMMQVGAYRGVPLYVDATLEPFSHVLVPVAGGLMRRYERLRTEELGT